MHNVWVNELRRHKYHSQNQAAIDLSRNDSSHGLPRSDVVIKYFQNRQAGISLHNYYLKHSIVFNFTDH